MRASRPPTVRATVALLAGCAGVLHAGLARAAPFDLDWSAPEGCPSRERIVAASRERLGESESEATAALFVRGRVAIEDGAIVVDLLVKDAAGAELGERRVRFTEGRCDAIEEPTALMLAMLIVVARSGDPPPADAAKQAPEPVAKPAPERRPPPPPPTRTPALPPMTIGASAVTSIGLFPSAGFGGAVRWTMTFSVPLVLGVEGSFETSRAAPAASGEASFLSFDGAALAGVSVARSQAFELVPLLQARAGIMAGSTRGFPSAFDAQRFVGSGGVGALGRVMLGPALRLEVLPDLRVALTRDEFQVREGGKLFHVHRPALVEARLSVGVAWEFR